MTSFSRPMCGRGGGRREGARLQHGDGHKRGGALQGALAEWGLPWCPPQADDWLLALDDTDSLDSPGTGFRARELALHLAQRGLARPVAITRHQLLVDPAIPYTSHNSSACIVLRPAPRADDAAAFALACSHLGAAAAPGSDVGLVWLQRARAAALLGDWGRRAKREVLTLAAARHLAAVLAAEAGLRHAELSGTGGGLIGAMAAVGLHARGEDGRLLWLRGVRELADTCCSVAQVEAAAGVTVCTAEGVAVAARPGGEAELVDPGDWPRAVYLGHRPVLLVEEDHEQNNRFGARWRSLPRERVKQLSS